MEKLWKSSPRYAPLDGHDEAASRLAPPPASSPRYYLWALITLVCWTCAVGFVGVAIGRHSYSPVASESIIALNTVSKTFRYNRTFAEDSERATQAWAEFWPVGGAFFTHPDVGKKATLAVYHQLHCIDSIRQGYWAAFSAAISTTPLNETSLPDKIAPPHVRHCLDLLRQSLMCQADTTFELDDLAAKGVHGFGVEHRCRDWDQLVRLTEGWNGR